MRRSRWQEEIWVTGLGCVSSAGVGTRLLADLLASGGHGLRDHPVTRTTAGTGPDPPRLRTLRHLDRTAQYFVLAAEEAWSSAGLPGMEGKHHAAVIEGSSLGSMADLLAVLRPSAAGPSPRRPHASHLVRYMPDAGAMTFAQAHRIDGPVYAVSAGSVSGALAILQGCQRLAAGEVDVAIAGGSECPLDPDIIDTFLAAGVLSEPRPCRPFDRYRTGTVLGEGSGVLVLERAGAARARGAHALARILGGGQHTEHSGRTAPHPEGVGISQAARQALETAGPIPVEWIKAHGTGTRAGDAAELYALHAVLGDQLRTAALTSLKSSLGHTLGASGALEAVAAVLALQRRLIPATRGHEQPDPALPLCRVNRAVSPASGGPVLLLAESFGGRCTAMVIAPLREGRSSR